ncbi:MAG: hypothetical protein JSV05_09915 [Candidatus Bathyarchaeota archaeon]|nr:MAG: hypothetical protein JSV05_09915 [Candidatus Bathyarchaeota archaeon]
MPISKHEFDNGKLNDRIEEEIINFLNERKKRAFTSQEVMEGIRYHTEFNTPEIIKMSTFAVADFAAFLHFLVEKKKIRMKVVRTRMYFMAGGAKFSNCPKCGTELKPKKTWKMAGRPNRQGESLQLHIGLFSCPKHGSFRRMLGKQKIKAQIKKRLATKKKKKALIKRDVKKKAVKRKSRKKKSDAWIIV